MSESRTVLPMHQWPEPYQRISVRYALGRYPEYMRVDDPDQAWIEMTRAESEAFYAATTEPTGEGQ